MSIRHVAVVILNYNSEEDLQACTEQIAKQLGVQLSIILVDNASRPSSLAAIKSWIADWNSEAICGTVKEIDTFVSLNPEHFRETDCVFLIENHVNRGYSAGNNIGIHLAEMLGAEAVLIINPDVRIPDQYYIHTLESELFLDSKNVLAASTIRNLSGTNENPMQELNFAEELLWPAWMLLSKFSIHPPSQKRQQGQKVEKICGACFLARTSFLLQIGLLDEGTFLYCEEAILAAQVRAADKRIAYVSEIEVLHAHVTATKGDPVKRFKTWIKSRRYYHRRYSGYGPLRRGLLYLSQACVMGLITLRKIF